MKISHYTDLFGKRQTLVKGSKTVAVTKDNSRTPYQVRFTDRRTDVVIAVFHDRGQAMRRAIRAAF